MTGLCRAWHGRQPGVSPHCWRTGMLVLAYLSLSACHQASPETALQNSIDSMVKAGQAHSVGGIMAHIAADFSGQDGRIDRRQLHALLRFQMLRNAVIHVLVTHTDIALHGNTRAVVQLDVLLTGGAGLLPQRGRPLHITTGWRYRHQWKMVNASWDE